MSPRPSHVAIIMDGNGRWAAARGLPRSAGHRRGVEAVRQVVRTAREAGLSALTLYAFSAQNWGRPRAEVDHLMGLLRGFLETERAEILRSGIRLCAIGDLARLPATARAPLALLERASATNRGMLLCLALSYDGRGALVEAARKLAAMAAAGRLPPEAVTEATFAQALSTHRLPALDLIVRTSGEQRLSNFLPYGCHVAGFRRRRPAGRDRGVRAPPAPLRSRRLARGRRPLTSVEPGRWS